MNPIENQKNLLDIFRGYVDMKLELGKLKMVDKSAAISAVLISMVAIFLITFLAVAFLSIGAALMLAKYLHSYYVGFIVVRGFYLIVFLVTYKLRVKWIKKPVTKDLIQKMLN